MKSTRGDEGIFERRVRQFRGYIEPMHARSRRLGEFCFVIFEDAFEGEGGGAARSVAKPRRVAAGARVGGADVFTRDDIEFLDALDAEMDEEYPRRRYIQFGFEEDYFFMDMPIASIFADEAEEVMAARRGFRYASENPLTPSTGKEIKDFDPLQKFYLYGEEAEAAEDAASIFFEVWELPATTRLYASSHSYSGRNWENGEPFE